MSTKSRIIVNKLTKEPTLLWQQLMVKQQQRKLPVNQFTDIKCEKKQDHVRFVLISDTHGHEIELPDGDVLIHGGDFSKVGKPKEIDNFNDYMGKIKHKFKHVIVICGNHEITFDPYGAPAKDYLLDEESKIVNHADMKKKLTNCTYIEDEAVEVMGFKIYGSPWQPEFHGWAYNLPRGEKCLEKWNLIPDDTDVLITHGPPLGYADLCSSGLRAGCAELLSTIQQRVRPRLHVFGHIHEGYGVWRDDHTTFVNASTCTLRYKPVNLPIVVDLKPKN